MRRVYLIIAIALTTTACLAQVQQPNQPALATVAAQAGSQERASVSSGDRTIVGCVAMGAPGYVLKTDDGSTFPLRSMTDLAPYVGKKVQIHATWTATGVHVAGPIEGTSGATPAGATGTKTAADFAGDIHLQLQGKVLGDCLGKK
jgi:hypothetical protein